MPRSNSKGDVEEGYDQMEDVGHNLSRAKTSGAVSISAELFEKLYLSPKNAVKGELRRTFGNPTPLGLAGFLIALTPLSCDLMGWRGAGGSGAAGVGTYYFFGGMLQFIGGLLEWVLGNTFPSVVFCSFGAFFLSFGATLTPYYAASSAYAPAGEDAASGLSTQGFNASFGFFMLWMGVLSFLFLVCSFRTNVCFVIVFLGLVLTFAFLSAAYWLLAHDFTGNGAKATSMIVAAGACAFVSCCSGWWIFFAIILESVDFPLQLPIGDLGRFIKPRAKLNDGLKDA